jgi:hypothetical protein
MHDALRVEPVCQTAVRSLGTCPDIRPKNVT